MKQRYEVQDSLCSYLSAGDAYMLCRDLEDKNLYQFESKNLYLLDTIQLQILLYKVPREKLLTAIDSNLTKFPSLSYLKSHINQKAQPKVASRPKVAKVSSVKDTNENVSIRTSRYVSGHYKNTCCVATISQASGIKYYDVLKILIQSNIYGADELSEKEYGMDDRQWKKALKIFDLINSTQFRINNKSTHQIDITKLNRYRCDFVLTHEYSDGCQHVMVLINNKDDQFVIDCGSSKNKGIRRDFGRLNIVEAYGLRDCA